MLLLYGHGPAAADGQTPGEAGHPRAIAHAYPEGAARALGHAAQYHAWLGDSTVTFPNWRDTPR